MSNYAITNTSEFYEFHRTCKDVSKAIRRAYRGKPRKTDAVLLDDLVEIIRGTAGWAKTVKPVRQTERGTAQGSALRPTSIREQGSDQALRQPVEQAKHE